MTNSEVARVRTLLAKAKVQTETQIVRAILDYLAANRILAWRSNVGAARNPAGRLVRFGVKGMPDIAGVLPGGHALFLEVKRRHGRMSPEQDRMQTRLMEAGALVSVVHGIAEVRAILKAYGLEALESTP